MRYDITIDRPDKETVRRVSSWMDRNEGSFKEGNLLGVNIDTGLSQLYTYGTQITYIKITGITDLKGFTEAVEKLREMWKTLFEEMKE